MSWKIRHEGSSRSVEGLSQAQVVEGLQDGVWEPTDEVMGLADADWVAIESHPQFAELAAELEPPPARHHEDETRLDMNPLIDVCLVLLIFFILTTTYAALERVLDMPKLTRKDAKGPIVASKQVVEKVTIRVDARLEGGKPVIRIEGNVVNPAHLVAELSRYVKQTGKTELLVDGSDDVPWEIMARIQDAAKGAKIEKIHMLVPENAPAK